MAPRGRFYGDLKMVRLRLRLVWVGRWGWFRVMCDALLLCLEVVVVVVVVVVESMGRLRVTENDLVSTFGARVWLWLEMDDLVVELLCRSRSRSRNGD